MPEQPQFSSSPTSMPSNAGRPEAAERLGDVKVHEAELVRLRDHVDGMRRVLVVRRPPSAGSPSRRTRARARGARAARASARTRRRRRRRSPPVSWPSLPVRLTSQSTSSLRRSPSGRSSARTAFRRMSGAWRPRPSVPPSTRSTTSRSTLSSTTRSVRFATPSGSSCATTCSTRSATGSRRESSRARSSRSSRSWACSECISTGTACPARAPSSTASPAWSSRRGMRACEARSPFRARSRCSRSGSSARRSRRSAGSLRCIRAT